MKPFERQLPQPSRCSSLHFHFSRSSHTPAFDKQTHLVTYKPVAAVTLLCFSWEWKPGQLSLVFIPAKSVAQNYVCFEFGMLPSCQWEEIDGERSITYANISGCCWPPPFEPNWKGNVDTPLVFIIHALNAILACFEQDAKRKESKSSPLPRCPLVQGSSSAEAFVVLWLSFGRDAQGPSRSLWDTGREIPLWFGRFLSFLFFFF